MLRPILRCSDCRESLSDAEIEGGSEDCKPICRACQSREPRGLVLELMYPLCDWASPAALEIKRLGRIRFREDFWTGSDQHMILKKWLADTRGWGDRKFFGLKLSEIAELLRAEVATIATPATPPAAKKPKHSTERGEARIKIVAALTKHHKYADGGCQNFDPIGVRELEKYGVGRDAATRFFKKHFGSHAKYKIACGRDHARIGAWLKLLNEDYSTHPLFSSDPPESSVNAHRAAGQRAKLGEDSDGE